MYRKIVWIASYPKSGNTWLRCFLDAYILGDIDINDIITSISDNVIGPYHPGLGINAIDLPIAEQQLCRSMAILRMVIMHNQNRDDSFPLFIKTHNPHLISNGIELIPETLTRAVIHIVRDPRDILPSYAKHMGLDIDTALDRMQNKFESLKGGDKRVTDLISSWNAHTESYYRADTHNVMTVRYEDMKYNPIPTFSQIVKHIGLEVDEERIKKALEMVKLSRLREKEKTEGFKESSPKAENAFFQKHEGRKLLEHRHYHKIDKVFGRLMKRLGYDKAQAA